MDEIFSLQKISELIRPVAAKYKVKAIYLFGSYARGQADGRSDLDFLVYGGANFKLTNIFALAEEIRQLTNKNVDVFEISEVDKESNFYKTVMNERIWVA